MSRSRQIAINAASQWGVTILGAALGLVLVPFLIVKLGKDGYGLIALTIAVSSVCTLAEFGISNALSRQLAEALAKKDDDKYRELFSTALGLNLLTGLACTLAVFMLAPQLAKAFALPRLLFDTGVFLLRTYGAANVLFAFLVPSANAVLASHNRFDTAIQIGAVKRLFETAGLFLVLGSAAAGIAGWALVCVTSTAICTALLWRAAAKTHPGLGVGLSAMRLSSVKELFSLGSQFTVLQLSAQLSYTADPFILTALLGPASVSLYRPPAQGILVGSPLVLTLANQLHPLATKAHVEGNREDLIAILFRGTKYTMLMGAVYCAIVFALAYPLCKIWLGEALGEQYRICAALLMVLAVTQFGAFAGGMQWPVLLGMRRTSFAAYGRLALAVLNIVSSWLLVKYTRLGVLGVVIPTMVIELVWRPVLTYYVCRLLDVSVRQHLREAYLSPLMICGAVAAVGCAAARFAPPEHLYSLVATTATLCLLGAALIWLVGFNGEDRAAMVRLARFARLNARLN